MSESGPTRPRLRGRAARGPAADGEDPPHLRPAAARPGGGKRRIDPEAALSTLLEDGQGASPLVAYRPLLARAFADARERVLGETDIDRYGLSKYAQDPVNFAREQLGHQLWAASRATMRALIEHHYVAVSACRKSSKSWTGSELVLAMTCSAPTICVTTSATWAQLRNVLWGKIQLFYNNARGKLPGRCLTTELRIAPDWYAVGITTSNPANIQGFHAGLDLPAGFDDEVAELEQNCPPPEPGEWHDPEETVDRALWTAKKHTATRLFFLIDEAVGIKAPIIETMKGSWMGDNVYVLMQFNPTLPPDSAHPAMVAMRKGSQFHRIHIAGEEFSPELESEPADACFHSVPEVVMPAVWREERRREWLPDSPLFRAHVLGLSASATLEFQFVPFRILRGAFANEEKLAALDAPDAQSVDLRLRARHIGWDVAASDSGDWNVATLWVHGLLTELEEWRCADTMESLEHVLALADKWGLDGKAIPGRNIHIDGTGVGKGPADRLRQMGRQIDVVDFGTKAKGDWPKLCGEMVFVDRKAELLWVFRRALQEGLCCVPRRFADVVKQAQWYTFEEVSRAEGTALRVVEGKDDIRELYGRSPDQLESGLVAWSRSNPRPRFRTLHSMRDISRVMA